MAQSSASNNQANAVTNILSSKEIDFIYSFRPFYYFSRVPGLMPFTIIYDSRDAIYKPAVEAFDICWFMFSVSFYVSTAIASVRISQLQYNTTIVLDHGDCAWLIACMTFGVLVIAMNLCNRFKFVDILNKFNSFDEKVRPISIFNIHSGFYWCFYIIFQTQMAGVGTHFDYKRENQRNWLWCIAQIPILLLSLSSPDMIRSVKVFMFFSVVGILQYFAFVLTSIIYIIFMFSLYRRFYALNAFFRLVRMIPLIEKRYWLTSWILFFPLFQIEVDVCRTRIWSMPLNSLEASMIVWLVLWINWIFATHFRFLFRFSFSFSFLQFNENSSLYACR